MDEIIKEVVELLQANGGSMVYEPLYNAVSDKAKRRLYPTLRNMKRMKQVALVNRVDPDTRRAVFFVSLVSDGGG